MRLRRPRGSSGSPENIRDVVIESARKLQASLFRLDAGAARFPGDGEAGSRTAARADPHPLIAGAARRSPSPEQRDDHGGQERCERIPGREPANVAAAPVVIILLASGDARRASCPAPPGDARGSSAAPPRPPVPPADAAPPDPPPPAADPPAPPPDPRPRHRRHSRWRLPFRRRRRRRHPTRPHPARRQRRPILRPRRRRPIPRRRHRHRSPAGPAGPSAAGHELEGAAVDHRSTRARDLIEVVIRRARRVARIDAGTAFAEVKIGRAPESSDRRRCCRFPAAHLRREP